MTPIHVLHLEDSPLDAELILASLTDGGIECAVVRVDTRAAFLAALRSGPVDLILADYSLPSFDGIAALHLARDLCPEVPFIFVSGALGEELAIETLKNGATDYVLKHRLERLAPSVLRALREARDRSDRLKAREELRESEERFRLLVESTEDYAIISLDPSGRVLSWNPGAERTLGYAAEEIVGKPFDLFFTSEDIASGRPARELYLAEETGRADDENWLVRRDGSRFWASGVTTSLRDEAERLAWLCENPARPQRAKAVGRGSSIPCRATGRIGSPQRRFPGHARPRATQPAGSDSNCRGSDGQKRPDRSQLAVGSRRY